MHPSRDSSSSLGEPSPSASERTFGVDLIITDVTQVYLCDHPFSLQQMDVFSGLLQFPISFVRDNVPSDRPIRSCFRYPTYLAFVATEGEA
jgi:hypothetical protein